MNWQIQAWPTPEIFTGSGTGPVTDEVILTEGGPPIELEAGGYFLLENQNVLLEAGGDLLVEDGTNVLLE